MTMETKRGERTVEKVTKKTPGLGGAEVPAMGGVAGSLVPKEGQDMFMKFAATRPRIMALLSKTDLSAAERRQIKAAYKACAEENSTRAIVVQEAPTLAPVLGISEEETAGYLEVYRPEELRAMAVVAQREELETGDVLSVDLALLEDGSYSGRKKETLTVSIAHDALSRHLEEELTSAGLREAVAQEDENLDNLWERLVEKYDGDEEKATEEYAKAAEDMLLGKKSEVKERTTDVLSTGMVVEIFKLFNYDRDDVERFVEFATGAVEVTLCESEEETVRRFIENAVARFVEEKAFGVILNERSSLYKNARARQITSLVAQEQMPPEALAEIEGQGLGEVSGNTEIEVELD